MAISDEKAIQTVKLVEQGGIDFASKEMGIKIETVVRYLAIAKASGIETTADTELLEMNVRYKKEKQRFQDVSRIERKTFREYARIENAIEGLTKGVIDALDKIDVSKYCVQHEQTNNDCCGIAQLNDEHFNELVSKINNQYDFNMAAKRMKLFAIRVKEYFTPKGIKNILIAMVGDMLNSDRRLDEKLTQATNRSNATVLALYLMEQFIIDINQDFNVMIAAVSGNESRVNEIIGYTDIMVTDNYDLTVFNMLKWHMKDCAGLQFITGNPSELVVKVAGQNVLLIHGHTKQIKGSDIEGAIQKIIGKYAKKGVLINFVLLGHVHSTNISDYHSRGASLVGDNDFSDYELQVSGRAAQNVHIMYSSGNRDSIKIDLQDVGKIKGYNIVKELECYNAKSAQKLRDHKTIFEVIV